MGDLATIDKLTTERDEALRWKRAALKAFPAGFDCVRLQSHLDSTCREFDMKEMCPLCDLNALIDAETTCATCGYPEDCHEDNPLFRDHVYARALDAAREASR